MPPSAWAASASTFVLLAVGAGVLALVAGVAGAACVKGAEGCKGGKGGKGEVFDGVDVELAVLATAAASDAGSFKQGGGGADGPRAAGGSASFLVNAGFNAERAAALSLAFTARGYEGATDFAAMEKDKLPDLVLKSELGMMAPEVRKFRAALKQLHELKAEAQEQRAQRASLDFADGGVELTAVAMDQGTNGKDAECVAFLASVNLAEALSRIEAEVGGSITLEELCNPGIVSDRMLLGFELSKAQIRRFRRAVRKHADKRGCSSALATEVDEGDGRGGGGGGGGARGQDQLDADAKAKAAASAAAGTFDEDDLADPDDIGTRI